ncbi:MAG: hypothetical protein KAS78_02565 [Candidatus Pacebacteria bacterium]|nr:hypothetical protein [Candidatus Paceibacterota bacterium]
MALPTDDLTLEELCALRKDLKTALFTGAKKIRHNERETEFQSVQQMQRALDQLEREIAAKSGTRIKTVVTPTTIY